MIERIHEKLTRDEMISALLDDYQDDFASYETEKGSLAQHAKRLGQKRLVLKSFGASCPGVRAERRKKTGTN